MLSYIRYDNSQVGSLTGNVTILSCRPSRPWFRLVNADTTIRAGRAEITQRGNTAIRAELAKLKQRDNPDVCNNRLQTATVDRTSLF